MKDKNSKNFQIGAKLVGTFLGEIVSGAVGRGVGSQAVKL